MTTPAPTVPEVDLKSTDDVLLKTVEAEVVDVVPSTGRSSLQSHSARAWTMGGQVD